MRILPVNRGFNVAAEKAAIETEGLSSTRGIEDRPAAGRSGAVCPVGWQRRTQQQALTTQTFHGDNRMAARGTERTGIAVGRRPRAASRSISRTRLSPLLGHFFISLNY